MDLSATYRSGAPAGVTLIADAFHLVKLANRKIDDAFRRLGYRTEHAHEDTRPAPPAALHAPLQHREPRPDHLATIIGRLDADGDGQQIAAVWIAKEHLRDLLALRATRHHVTPAPSAVRDKLASFYIWCADHDDIPEIKTLAKTIGKWQQPVIDAVLTGYSNAKAEAHNRTAKLVARNARGFANPGNQARRVRMATTRAARRPGPRQQRTAVTGSSQGTVADGDAQAGRGTAPPPAAPRLSTEKLRQRGQRGSSGACLWSMRRVPSWAFACLSEFGVAGCRCTRRCIHDRPPGYSCIARFG